MRARMLVLGVVLVLLAPGAFAQQTPAPAPRLFMPAGEVTALIAKAKAERKSDQANFSQPLLRFAPWAANLEYRVAGLNANASVHERDAEMFIVVEGAGTLVTGGKLVDEKRSNPTNLQGSGIEGGTERRLGKGDFVIVPENVPHWFGKIDGALVLMSMHLPQARD